MARKPKKSAAPKTPKNPEFQPQTQAPQGVDGGAEISPPDLDGDGKPGGSLSQLAWDCAEVAWAAVFRWSAIKQVDDLGPWADLTDADRLVWAIAANQIINGRDDLPFADERWEASVRGKIFAAVVRSIAL